jgi:predicted TIM-barrel fold metal-dependent hydrolase
VHIGYNEEILRGSDFNSIQKFKHDNDIENMLLFPFYNESQEVIDRNHDSITQLNKTDKGIKGLYWLNEPWLTTNKIDEILNNGFIGLKYHGVYTNKPISDPIWNNILMWLNVKRGILLVHCGMFKEGDMASNTSFLHPLIVASKYRNIKVILGHAGGSILPVIKKACDYAKNVDNVWLETSGITSPVSVDYMTNTMGVRKILFGSDYPYCSFKSMLHNVLDSNLPEGKKKLILNDNLYDILK